jgi:hypothetical protein
MKIPLEMRWWRNHKTKLPRGQLRYKKRSRLAKLSDIFASKAASPRKKTRVSTTKTSTTPAKPSASPSKATATKKPKTASYVAAPLACLRLVDVKKWEKAVKIM